MSVPNPKKLSKKFNFIPNVRQILTLISSPDAQLKDIIDSATQFRNNMEEAQKILNQIPGLDMTEEEQIQKIEDLKNAIKQKKRLLEECERCYQSWGLDSTSMEQQPDTPNPPVSNQ